MKKITIFFRSSLLFTFLLFISFSSTAQQWGGSTSQTNAIYRSGNVGIGGTSPSQFKLGIRSTTNPALQIKHNTTQASVELAIATFNGSYSNIAKTGDVVFRTGGYVTGDFIIASRSSDDIVFTTGAWNTEAEKFRIDVSGRVTVGAFASNTLFESGYKFFVDQGIYAFGAIKTKNDLLVDGMVRVGNVSTPNIGSGYKMYVERGILTERVKVALSSTTDWFDHVFEPEYELMSLHQLKKFIETNKHLPDIPSAQELVDEGGVELKEMTQLHMKKIEELTLYILEMNERLEKLEKENEELKKGAE